MAFKRRRAFSQSEPEYWVCVGSRARSTSRDLGTQSVLTTGTITAHFERKAGKVTYSNRPLTRAETRMEIVKWVCESTRPFNIVRDPGFLLLMKTSRPNFYVPSPSTVARDVKEVFACTHSQVAKMLQVSRG